MKKTKLIMPIIGISALGTSLVPLTTLTSCSKTEFKVELTQGSKEKELYASTQVVYYYFSQNNLENSAKTKTKLTNLKVDGSEATTVSGLVKTVIDSAGNIRVAIDVETMFSHYSNPETIEFDLLFTNKVNNQECTVSGFKFTRNIETYDTLFATDESGTTITGFADGFDIETAAENYPLIFMPFDLPVYPATSGVKSQYVTYRMVIPKSTYTAIGEGAFAGDKLRVGYNAIASIDFAADSTISTIGAKAFAESAYLVSIKLPKSITTLGEGCFCACNYLTSLIFPDKIDSTKGLTLPDGMAAGSPISYVKIPTYITSIGTGQSCVFSYGSPMIMDLSEWSANLLKTTTSLFNSKSAEGAVNAIASTEEAYTLLLSTAFKFNACCVPYKFESTPERSFAQITAIRSTENKIPGFELLNQWLLEIRNSMVYKIQMPALFAFPNYYTEGETTYPITGFYTAVSEQIAYWTQQGFFYSVVLPTNFTGLAANIFNGNGAPQNLWQLHIPSSLQTDAIYAGVFANQTQLYSIVFDGTETEWAPIKTALLQADANYGCNPIDVYGNGFTDTLEYTAE